MSARDRVDHWIGGKRLPGAASPVLPVYDPSTGSIVAEAPVAGGADVDQAVSAARAGVGEWGSAPLSRRADAMFALRELLDARRNDLASAVSREHGKVLGDALGEVDRGIECVEFACGIPNLIRGSFSAEVSAGVDVHSIRQPVGVVAGITPFNFPVMVPLWMLANAIACGNGFILKPSERDPSPSLLLAEMIAEAGVPSGVFNVVQGDRSTVECLVDHPDVAAVSFVGSTPVARQLYSRATAAGKRVQALGGAKNHMVVLPDASVDLAADSAVSAAFGSAGERCMAISVVVAVGDSADPVVDAIAERLPGLHLGPSDDPSSDIGPLITAGHLEKVKRYVAEAEAAGATVVADGREHPLASGASQSGFYLGPTLVDHVRPGMPVYDDEIFGPVLAVVRVPDLAEAIRLVNDNPYGNGAALFTQDGAAARLFERSVSCGMVGVNVPIPVPVAYYSFGGWKSSLFGDLRMYGQAGVDFYTREKVVTSRWPQRASGGVDLHFPVSG